MSGEVGDSGQHMSGELSDSGALQIIDSILSEAEAQAGKRRDEGARAAKAELARAERQAETVREGIVKQGEQVAAKAYAREMATAKTEVRRILLATREERVQRATVQIEEELQALRSDPTRYRTSLRNLALEAVLAVDAPEVVLKLAKSEAGMADSAFIEGLARSVQEATGHAPALTVDLSLEDLGGGCLAMSGNGRVVFDNTFHRRMERAAQEIRAAVIKEAAQENG